MSQAACLDDLRRAAPAILPSLLLCDFGNLAREIGQLEEAGVPALHLDVMDGHFVPNLTYGMPIVAAARRATRLPLETHLMIERPEAFIGAFREAGADIITIHVEAAENPGSALRAIRRSGAAAGLAISPNTPTERLEPWLNELDLLLVMSVMPGFGGQSFQRHMLDRLSELRCLAPQAVLEIDGGVNDQTIASCAEAGAETFVVGSAIFNHQDYAARVHTLRALALEGQTQRTASTRRAGSSDDDLP